MGAFTIPTPPRIREPLWLVGLDLGQRRDYTALAVVQRTDTLRPSGELRVAPTREARYAVKQLDRIRGVSYETVAERMVALLKRPELAKAQLAVDGTGVGVAVLDMLEARGLRPERVTITGGLEATSHGREHHVPKRDLASAVAVLLDAERLLIDEALPLAPALTGELENFRVKLSPTGHASFEAGTDWRENEHDDLVLAVALAVWLGEQPSRELWKGRS